MIHKRTFAPHDFKICESKSALSKPVASEWRSTLSLPSIVGTWVVVDDKKQVELLCKIKHGNN